MLFFSIWYILPSLLQYPILCGKKYLHFHCFYSPCLASLSTMLFIKAQEIIHLNIQSMFFLQYIEFKISIIFILSDVLFIFFHLRCSIVFYYGLQIFECLYVFQFPFKIKFSVSTDVIYKVTLHVIFV